MVNYLLSSDQKRKKRIEANFHFCQRNVTYNFSDHGWIRFDRSERAGGRADGQTDRTAATSSCRTVINWKLTAGPKLFLFHLRHRSALYYFSFFTNIRRRVGRKRARVLKQVRALRTYRCINDGERKRIAFCVMSDVETKTGSMALLLSRIRQLKWTLMSGNA